MAWWQSQQPAAQRTQSSLATLPSWHWAANFESSSSRELFLKGKGSQLPRAYSPRVGKLRALAFKGCQRLAQHTLTVACPLLSAIYSHHHRPAQASSPHFSFRAVGWPHEFTKSRVHLLSWKLSSASAEPLSFWVSTCLHCYFCVSPIPRQSHFKKVILSIWLVKYCRHIFPGTKQVFRACSNNQAAINL